MSRIAAPLSGSPLRVAARPPPAVPSAAQPPACDVRSALLDEHGIDAPTLVALQDVVLKDTYAAWADAKAAAATELAALLDAVSALERLPKPASPPPAEAHHAAALAAAVVSRRSAARTPPRGSSPFVRGRRGGAATAVAPTPRIDLDESGNDDDDLPDALPATPFPLPLNADMRESIVRDPLPLPVPPPDSSSSL